MIKIAKWLIEVNVDKIREFYNKDLKICNCLSCNNFVEACKYLKTPVLDVFKKLGINPAKPAHLSEFPTMKDGLRQYIRSYHFVGEVLEGEMSTNSNSNETNTFGIEHFSFGFSEEIEFLQEDFPSPVVQLDFDVYVSWVFNESPDE
ncbi:hypothetical protein AWH48_11665 [Domibacillus aminovorans]|uniref:Uncharacterized protein n=1 Tax=Domibacillus aminovorans TaxID=29332 RepID=A0A177KKJ3_9BACI|nr:hypothetical protein [Domibacillus aminovorans]OAH53918.1 hypothetical protein AWH48_11665 [Domibacillus aminovorans]